MTVVLIGPSIAPAWDAFVTRHPAGWLWHSYAWLRYEASRPGATQMSVALLDDSGKIVALVPAILESGEAQAAGEPLADPLSDGVPMPELLKATIEALGVKRIRYRGMPVPKWSGFYGLSPAWHDISWQTQVVDLSQSEADLFHGLRKSYRSGATDVRKLAQIARVVTGPQHLDDFRTVHESFWVRESGAVALNDQQWDIIGQWVKQGIGRLYGVPGEAWILVYSFKKWSYYASGPSLTPGLGALLQWTAMLDLKHAGMRFYELGWHARPGEDEKHQRISFFKQGMGGLAWTVPAMEWAV